MNADEIFSKKSAVEILICMKSVIERNADRVSFDQIRSKRDQLLKWWWWKKNRLIKKNADGALSESAVNFDAYKVIFIHSFLSVMFVFFIAVFWFFLNFVKITTFFEIDDDQHVTKTAMKHVVVIFKNQIFSKLWHVAEHSKTFHIDRIQKFSFDDFNTIYFSWQKE